MIIKTYEAHGSRVAEVDRNTVIPGSFTMEFAGERGVDWVKGITATITTRDGCRPEIMELRLTAWPNDRIWSQTLRFVKPIELIRMAVEEVAMPWGQPQHNGSPKLSDEFLAEVAAYYLARLGDGSTRPMSDLVEKYKVSRTTGFKWIKRARESGILEPATEDHNNGKSGR